VCCICYLWVGDTEHVLYVAILLHGLEDRDRDIELPILLHPLGLTSRPVLVAHLLQSRLLNFCTARNSQECAHQCQIPGNKSY